MMRNIVHPIWDNIYLYYLVYTHLTKQNHGTVFYANYICINTYNGSLNTREYINIIYNRRSFLDFFKTRDA